MRFSDMAELQGPSSSRVLLHEETSLGATTRGQYEIMAETRVDAVIKTDRDRSETEAKGKSRSYMAGPMRPLRYAMTQGEC